MKFYLHTPQPLRPRGMPTLLACLILLACASGSTAQHLDSGPAPAENRARMLAFRTMQRLANGDAFDAKLRQRIWAGGRNVVGVGHYEQSGGGTGRYSLEMTIHDGDSRQTMKQISDGKLAWNRAEVANTISVRRIDLGRIDEHEQELLARTTLTAMTPAASSLTAFPVAAPVANKDRLPARLLAGGLIELLDRIRSDYELRLGQGTVDGRPVWILRGTLCEGERMRILKASGRDELAPLCPGEVLVAIAATADANGFGAGLPLSFEFWTSPDSTVKHPAPVANDADPPSSQPAAGAEPAGRLISLLEIYSMRKIQPSPEERFRFISDDRDVTFINDTGRYIERIAVP